MKRTLVEQLRGATTLAVEATCNVTNIIEMMHQTIGGGPDVLGRPMASITKVITAPTYTAIRGVTNAVGAGFDLALLALTPLLGQVGVERGVLLTALNGVLGDYLAQTKNPLAIEMRLCKGTESLELTRRALQIAFPQGDRLVVLLHGSSMGEESWQQTKHDHGVALAADLGFVPVYLRYNSGLHVSQNGRGFATLLEQLVSVFPRPIKEIVFVGHSMGGLVARSACVTGEAYSHVWREKLSSLITLGTPHHGAPLERGGNWVDALLDISRYSAPIGRLGRLRSAGVTDLRYGNVLDADWHGQDRFARRGDTRTVLPLPAGVECFAIAATTAKTLSARPCGDGLVPVNSALGRHPNSDRNLDFDDSHQFVTTGTSHLDLLDSKEVYGKIRCWLEAMRP